MMNRLYIVLMKSGLIRALLFCALLLPIAVIAQVKVAPILPALPPTAELPPDVAADVAPPPEGKGYHLSEIKDDVYYVTDGNYQAMFVVHQQGVILVDAPEPLPFFPPLNVLAAIAEVTDKPITHLVYSHAHTDHIGGAGLVKDAFPNVKIIAHKETERILQQANDPRRPLPIETFRHIKTLRVGGKKLVLSYVGNTHMEGNIFIYAPSQKVLMVVDVIYPGWVPFRRLALSTDIAGWLRGHEAVLEFDFETLVSGHVTRLGNRSDVLVQREYVADLIATIESNMNDATTLFEAIGAVDAIHGAGTAFQTVAKWALFSAFYDVSTMRCADALDAKYLEGTTPGDNPKALGGAETFNFSNCEAYFVARRLGVER